MNTFSFIFLLAVIISFVVHYWLSRRQAAHVLQHRDQVPEAFTESISLEAHQKAADYTNAKIKVGEIHGFIDTVILLLLLFGGVINYIFEYWGSTDLSPLLAGVISIVCVTLLMSLLDLPTSIYQTFVIEERFGFNKNTPLQFIKDHLIQMALTAVIGLPLLALILWVMGNVGSYWWLLAWAIIMSFSLLMSWLFPTLIAPLFNKFTPLQEGELKDRIKGLLSRCGFNNNGIFIMDGSRRSGHGNAYFTGFGNNKRIVFFDTLVDSLNPEELEAVLAHELGHFKCKHVIKMLIATAILTLISLAILGWLAAQPWFYQGLGIQQASNAAALLLFMLVSPAFTLFLQPISAYFQRKHEFEADAFASTHTKASALISGLVKLYKENASTLTPDPIYSSFHYSHPPASIRIAHLEERGQQAVT